MVVGHGKVESSLIKCFLNGKSLDSSSVDSVASVNGPSNPIGLYLKVKSKQLSFLTPNAKIAFTQLNQVLIKAFLICHNDPECYIRIVTDIYINVIKIVQSHLTPDFA